MWLLIFQRLALIRMHLRIWRIVYCISSRQEQKQDNKVKKRNLQLNNVFQNSCSFLELSGQLKQAIQVLNNSKTTNKSYYQKCKLQVCWNECFFRKQCKENVKSPFPISKDPNRRTFLIGGVGNTSVRNLYWEIRFESKATRNNIKYFSNHNPQIKINSFSLKTILFLEY
jgi:hypothetical protein